MNTYSALEELAELQSIRSQRRYVGRWSRELETRYRASQRRAHRIPRSIMFLIMGALIGGAPIYGASLYLIDGSYAEMIRSGLVAAGALMFCTAVCTFLKPHSIAASGLQFLAVHVAGLGIVALFYLSTRGELAMVPSIAVAIIFSILIFGGYARLRMLAGVGTCFALLLWISVQSDIDKTSHLRTFGLALTSVIAILAVLTLDAIARIAWIERHYASLLSRTDPLTGLGTRAVFNSQFDNRIDQAAREAKGLAVMLLDMDHFKRLNDGYGHLFGDQVLKAVGRVILKDFASRAPDLRVRYGGEEILILWYDLDEATAVHLAHDMLEQIRQIELHSPTDDVRVPITASAGLVFIAPATRAPPQSVLRRADQLLYAAKSAGRDQLIAATVETSDKL